jgi:hypothetical protein
MLSYQRHWKLAQTPVHVGEDLSLAVFVLATECQAHNTDVPMVSYRRTCSTVVPKCSTGRSENTFSIKAFSSGAPEYPILRVSRKGHKLWPTMDIVHSQRLTISDSILDIKCVTF